MTIGMILIRWDDNLGPIVQTESPQNFSETFSEDDILTLFTTNALSEEPGIMSLTIKKFSVISYFSGKKKEKYDYQYVIALFLSEGESQNLFEVDLEIMAKILLSQIDKPDFQNLFSNIYAILSESETIFNEKYYALIFKVEELRFILNILREGPILKHDLSRSLGAEFKHRFSNLEELMAIFLQLGIVNKHEIQIGSKSMIYYLLIQDFTIMRSPNLHFFNLLFNNELDFNLIAEFNNHTEEFFGDYKVTIEDQKTIADLIFNPVSYRIIEILREGFARIEDLEQKSGINMAELIETLEVLNTSSVVLPLKDSAQQYWLMLLCNIMTVEFTPDYIINQIREKWEDNEIDHEVALKHIKLIESKLV